MSDLGLPEALSSKSSRQRSYVEYILTKELVLPEFFQTFTEADLTFGMTEPTPEQMEHAGKLAGSNPILMAKEMLFRSIIVVGDWSPKGARDASHETGIDAWWDLIGAKHRDMITQEFTSMMSPSEEEVTKFRDTRKIKTR